MAKQKKDYRPCSLRMDAEIYEILEDYCEKSGQSKTTAIERAVVLLAQEYDKKNQETTETN